MKLAVYPLSIISLSLSILCLACSAEAQTAGGIWRSEFYPQNSLSASGSVRIGENVTQYQFDTTVPLFSEGDGMLMALFSNNYDEMESENAASIGLGYGFVFDDLLAARFRVHGDFADTRNGNSIQQLSFGFDVFTNRGFDLHGNVYLPENESFSTGSVTQTGGGGGTRSRFEAPRATGNSIMQRQFLDTIASVTREFELREKARRGQDIRASFDIPIVSEYVSTRGTVGAYHYAGEDGYADLSGFLAGVHIFPFQGLMLGAEYFEDEALYGDNWMFTGGVTLAMNNPFSLKEWGSGLARAMSARPSAKQPADRQYLKARLFSNGARKSRPTVSSSAVLVREEVVFGGSTLVQDATLLANLTFVNNGGAVGNGIEAGAAGPAGDGTAERPFNDLTEGANSLGGADGTVYVQGGTGTPYGGVVNNTNSNLVFTSSFIPVQGIDNQVFGGNTPRPEVGIAAATLGLANGQQAAFRKVNGSLTVNGFAVNDATGLNNAQALFAINASLVATNNVVTNWDRGVTVFNGAATLPTVVVNDNRFDFNPTVGPNPADWWLSLQSNNNGPNGISIVSIQDNVVDRPTGGATGFNFNSGGAPGVRTAESGATPGDILLAPGGTISNNTLQDGTPINIVVP